MEVFLFSDFVLEWGKYLTMIFTEETALRIKIAKLYFDLVKEKMGEWFIDAYVFGSTCRNEAKEGSDIDVLFVFKRPSREERNKINSTEGGLWDSNRQGIICSTYNEHYTSVFMNQLENEYKIQISRYFHYEDNGLDHPIWLCGPIYKTFKELIKGALKYPEDLILENPA